MTHFISVIVPVFNAAAYLETCLTAIRASFYTDYELIVIDDGSSDASPAIAQRLANRVVKLGPLPRGPAHARNEGSRVAAGDLLFFVDADIIIRPETLTLIAETFERDATLAAVFGGYDDNPAAPSFISQYKNLFHHFMHQQANEEGGTFWSGCGAIRRTLFLELGGFDAQGYPRPSIEDIELGVRLRAAGHRIRLNKRVQVKHLKHWTFGSLVKTDVFGRGVPWTRLIMRERHLPDDLNLRLSQRASAILTYLLVGLLLVAAWREESADPPWVLSALAVLGAILWLNRDLYRFFFQVRGLWFTLAAVPLHLLYYLYSIFALVLGVGLYIWDRMRKRLPPTAVNEQMTK